MAVTSPLTLRITAQSYRQYHKNVKRDDAEVSIGGILLWSAVRNEKITDVTADIIRGQKPPSNGPAVNVSDSDTGAAGGNTSGAPTAPVSASKNVALGKVLATAYGWGSGSEWNSLYALWQRESGWSNVAQNASSGAYGIPQSLPGSKMGPLANPPVSSAGAQIKWGLSYIKERYGDPNGAWAHETSNGWY